MHGGYIKIWRKMLESEVMQDDWLCRLWVWCLMKARWTNGRLKRGQFVTTGAKASDELMVHRSKWVRGIEKLKEIRCVSVETNNQETIITICNYATYQDAIDEGEQRPDSDRTATEQRSDSDRTTHIRKEGKKERREEPAAPDCESFALEQLAADAAFDEGWGTDARRVTLWFKVLSDLQKLAGMPLVSLAEELGKSPDSEPPWDFRKRMEGAKNGTGQHLGQVNRVGTDPAKIAAIEAKTIRLDASPPSVGTQENPATGGGA